MNGVDIQNVTTSSSTLTEVDFIKTLSAQCLTEKEKRSEEFLGQFIQTFETCHTRNEGMSVDLSQQERLEKAEQQMNNCSVILAAKFKPILRDYIAVQEQKYLNDKYACVKSAKPNDDLLAKQYNTCINSFLDNVDCVSIKAHNKSALKNISPKDVCLLTLWAMNTNRRSQGDNLLSLIVAGRTSCGKSVLFENILQEVSHNLTGDSGVGRFVLNGKSSLLLHDCNLECLVKGRDVDKFKAMARTESFQTKVHSKTNVIPPTFLMATSNQHLFDHRFKTEEQIGYSHKTLYKSPVCPTFNRIRESDLEAVRYRFLEVFVRKRPDLPDQCLPSSGQFTRLHFILGLFDQILTILYKYKKDDFASDYYFIYAIAGLCKNIDLILDDDHQHQSRMNIIELINKYQLNSDQKQTCLDYLLN
jgi:hypothetical protein